MDVVQETDFHAETEVVVPFYGSLFFHAHAAVKETASLVTDYLAAVTAATTDVAETASSGLLS